ncbi:MAG: hypothetical protein KGJ13_11980 [Patescibacteria group bacterium]|nr:hypothetical protein [Patescibacteria group bacterium]
MIEYEKRWSVKSMTRIEKKLFYCWKGIKNRCYAPNSTAYKHYGARGILVSPLWKNDFLRFVEDVGFPPSLDMDLDRINTDGNYEPGNVRWITHQENMCNVRNNQWVEIDGVKKLASQWADEYGISRPTFSVRMKLGWTGKDLLAKPWTGTHTRTLTIRGVTKRETEWAKELGISQGLLLYRIKKQGIPLDSLPDIPPPKPKKEMGPDGKITDSA